MPVKPQWQRRKLKLKNDRREGVAQQGGFRYSLRGSETPAMAGWTPWEAVDTEPYSTMRKVFA